MSSIAESCGSGTCAASRFTQSRSTAANTTPLGAPFPSASGKAKFTCALPVIRPTRNSPIAKSAVCIARWKYDRSAMLIPSWGRPAQITFPCASATPRLP